MTNQRDLEQTRKNRFLIMLCIIVCEVILLILFFSLTPWDCVIKYISSNNLQTLIPLSLSAPFAFFIWKWRDENKINDQIQKDKDQETAQLQATSQLFFELQDRVLESEKENDRKAIAAIHQLEPFLLGYHGEDLQKYSLITLRTLLNENYDLVFNEINENNDFIVFESELRLSKDQRVIQSLHLLLKASHEVQKIIWDYLNVTQVKIEGKFTNIQTIQLCEGVVEASRFNSNKINFDNAFVRNSIFTCKRGVEIQRSYVENVLFYSTEALSVYESYDNTYIGFIFLIGFEKIEINGFNNTTESDVTYFIPEDYFGPSNKAFLKRAELDENLKWAKTNAENIVLLPKEEVEWVTSMINRGGLIDVPHYGEKLIFKGLNHLNDSF